MKNFQKNTVFKYANFKTMKDLENYYPETFIEGKECLFVPPTSDDSNFTLEKEKELAETEKGGFICALWQKID